VIAACADHARAASASASATLSFTPSSRVTAHIGDSPVARATAFHAETGIRPRISLLDYNAIGANDPFARSPRMPGFRDVLSAAGLPSHRRYSGGGDVAAACGQLRLARV
jgi:23S rRNA (adenine2503-C2)-methyltransferase